MMLLRRFFLTKSNLHAKRTKFRYGQMEKPRREESEKRNEEERKIREEKESEERRCVKRKEMQVREKVENPRSAEPSCGRRVEQFHALGVRSRFGSKNAKKTAASSYFWKLRCG